MATELERLVVRIEADPGKLVAELKRANRAVKTFEQTTSRGLGRFRQQFKRAGREVKNFTKIMAGLGVVAGAFATRGIFQATVAIQQVENALLAATGDAEQAADAFKFLRSEAERLGVDFESSAKGFSRIAAAAKSSNLTMNQLKDTFTAVAETSTVLNLSVDQVFGTFTAIEQIISKGTLQMEELRQQLGDRIPGASPIAAKALDVTVKKLFDMVAAGEIISEQFLPLFSKELRSTFGGALPKALGGALQNVNRLQTAFLFLKQELSKSGFLDNLTEAVQRLTESIKDPKFQSDLKNAVGLFSELFILGTKWVALVGATPEAFRTIFPSGQEQGQRIEQQNIVRQMRDAREEAERLEMQMRAVQEVISRINAGELEDLKRGTAGAQEGFEGTGVDVGVIAGERAVSAILGRPAITTESQEGLTEAEVAVLKLSDVLDGLQGDLKDTEKEMLRLAGAGNELSRELGAMAPRTGPDPQGGFVITPVVEDPVVEGGGVDEAAAKARAKAQQSIQEFLRSLEEESALLRVQGVEREKLAATFALENILRGKNLDLLDDALPKALEWVRTLGEQNQATEDAAKAEEMLNEQFAAARQVIEDVQTPQQKYNTEVERLRKLLPVLRKELGSLEKAQEVVAAATEKARKRMEDEIDATDRLGDAAEDLGFTFTSAFEDAIVNGEKLQDVLLALEKDILRILTRRIVTEPLADALGGLINVGLQGLQAFFAPTTGTSAGTTIASGAGVGGANVVGGGFVSTGFGIAQGGQVSGPGSSTSDSILARLSDGEFVVNARSARQNLKLLEAINDNRTPAFQQGGRVGRIGAAPTAAMVSSGQTITDNRRFDITIQAQDAASFEEPASRRQIHRLFAEQTRLGGG